MKPPPGQLEKDARAVCLLMAQGTPYSQAVHSTCNPYFGKQYREKVRTHLFAEGLVAMDKSSMHFQVTAKGMTECGL